MKFKTVLLMFACCTASVLCAQDKIGLEEIASGFTFPVCIAQTGDDRLFIVEKTGYIRIMDTLGQVLPDPFLDIDARVNSGSTERGLLGLAFHPDYATNGYFFVNYTDNAGNTVVARYSRDTLNENMADPSSEMILFTVTQPYSNHNGGNLAFGPDGYLYIGMGDGGNAGDPGNRAQNKNVLLGKLLRIDVDSGSPYGIPPDNPFAGADTARQEIWAYGMRNPWRYSFDRATGDLWIADVGQDAWEEIDYQPAGAAGGRNYGWRCKEGFANYNISGCPDPSVFTEPVYAYAHTGGGCSGSVTGGYVYRGSAQPYFIGKYICVDYCTGIFRILERDTSGQVTAEEAANLQNQEFTSFGEDASGELYVAGATGRIFRVVSLVSATTHPDQTQLTIRPNPVDQYFVIIRDDTRERIFSMYDLEGMKVKEFAINGDTRINTAALPEGAYYITLEDPDGLREIAKVIVLHR